MAAVVVPCQQPHIRSTEVNGGSESLVVQLPQDALFKADKFRRTGLTALPG